MTLPGQQSYASGATLAVTDGEVNITTNAGAPGAATLAIQHTGGTIDYNGSQNIYSVVQSGGIANTQLLNVGRPADSSHGGVANIGIGYYTLSGGTLNSSVERVTALGTYNAYFLQTDRKSVV